MMKRMTLETTEAVALAVKLANVDVIAAYPITPQTHIVEVLSEYVANGELDAEFLEIESEHSAISACLAAEAMGARTFTSSSSQGLALMHEILYTTAGLRLPVVMAVANRSLSAPLCVLTDFNDALAERDTGWIQIYVENAQEAFDSTLQAFRIAEDERVLLPAMVCFDGFYLSHATEPVEVLSPEEAAKFLPPLKIKYTLDPKKPVTMGAWVTSDHYMDFKLQQEEAIMRAKDVIKEVNEEFGRLFGRRYGNGLVDAYRTDDADVILVTMGCMTGTARVSIDRLREEGKKVGLVKLRTFRPFPIEDIVETMKDTKVVAVVSRDISLGSFGGVALSEVRSAFYERKERPHVVGFVAGLGGRDVMVRDFRVMVNKAFQVVERGVVEKNFEFIGV